MMDNEHGFPVALGVIRDVEAPTYEMAAKEQIEEVAPRRSITTSWNCSKPTIFGKLNKYRAK